MERATKPKKRKATPKISIKAEIEDDGEGAVDDVTGATEDAERGETTTLGAQDSAVEGMRSSKKRRRHTQRSRERRGSR